MNLVWSSHCTDCSALFIVSQPAAVAVKRDIVCGVEEVLPWPVSQKEANTILAITSVLFACAP